MSIDILYIDSSDEITSVIERLKASHEPIVALVVPKGALLTQSIVNLKLAKKAAGDAEKDLILVTTDKIGKNLASQVGITTANSEKDVAKVARGEVDASDDESASVIAGVRIHRYYDEGDPEQQEAEAAGNPVVVSQVATVAAESPIVPKNLLQNSPTPNQESVPVPTMLAEPEVTQKVAEAAPKPVPVQEPLKRTSLPEEPVEVIAPKDDETLLPTATTLPAAALTPALASTKQPSPNIDPKKRAKLRLIYLTTGIVCLIALLSSLFFLPRTTVTLTVSTKPWQQSIAAVGSVETQSVDDFGTKLPAERITQEGEVTATFQTTGTKRVGTAATGSATIFNSQDSTPVTLQAGAKLEANGRVFSTNQAVTVPGVTVKSGKLIPGSASVAITADVVGPEGNIANLAANITSPSTNLYAQIESTSGGTSKDVKVVAQADITNAKNALAKQLQESLATKLIEATANREVIFKEGSDLLSSPIFTSSLESNAEGESFQATSKGKLERIIVDKANITKVVESFLKNNETTQEKRVVDTTEIPSITPSFESNSVAIDIAVVGKITPVFKTDNLPSSLVGKSIAAGRNQITQSVPTSNVTIKQSPSWWPLKQFPRFAGSIVITTVYE